MWWRNPIRIAAVIALGALNAACFQPLYATRSVSGTPLGTQLAQVQVDHVDPVQAIRAVAEMTFDHHIEHQDFIRLVSIENIHRGEFIGRLDSLRTLGQPATSLLDQILTQGREQGVFREDVDALDVHILISSYCVFQVANRYTFGYLFDIDFTEQQTHAHLRRMLGDVVVGWLTSR